MGGCSSIKSRSGLSTAKLIHQDGQLQEFSVPVKVSQLLRKNPSSFICNSDDMDFDDVVSAVDVDEYLQPGHLYFLLHVSQMKRPLTASEMAALAVKANVALAGGGKHVLKVEESEFNEMKTGREIGGGSGWKRRNVVSSSGRGRVAVLKAIAE